MHDYTDSYCMSLTTDYCLWCAHIISFGFKEENRQNIDVLYIVVYVCIVVHCQPETNLNSLNQFKSIQNDQHECNKYIYTNTYTHTTHNTYAGILTLRLIQ